MPGSIANVSDSQRQSWPSLVTKAGGDSATAVSAGRIIKVLSRMELDTYIAGQCPFRCDPEKSVKDYVKHLVDSHFPTLEERAVEDRYIKNGGTKDSLLTMGTFVCPLRCQYQPNSNLKDHFIEKHNLTFNELLMREEREANNRCDSEHPTLWQVISDTIEQAVNADKPCVNNSKAAF